MDKKDFATKYAYTIGNVSRANNVDIGVATDMLIASVRGKMGEQYTDGAGTHRYEQYAGVNFDYKQCYKDIKAFD